MLRNGAWQKLVLRNALKKNPDDLVSNLYIKRCEEASDTRIEGLMQYRKAANSLLVN